MPVGLTASDQKILFVGGAVLAILMTLSVIFSPPGEQQESPVPSTYSGQSSGAEAAYLLLVKLGYPVHRIEEPPSLWKDVAANALIIFAEPLQSPTDKEKKALENFVANGGHILFTGPDVASFFSGAEISRIAPDQDWLTFSPTVPTPLGNGAGKISIRPRAYWGKLNENQLALYGEKDSVAVVRWRFGKGQILWWAGPTPLTNAGITREDNLRFLLNSVSDWTDPKEEDDYEIYWDEYFHGQRSSVWSYVSRTVFAWGLLQLGLVAAAVFFSFSRRSGPTFIPAGVSRLSPLEFVDTLGGLYERAGAASSAVTISYQRLRTILTRHLGLPSNTPNKELAQVAEQRLGWKNAGLGLALSRAEVSARDPKLPPHDALKIVQDLESQSARLDIRSQFHREKK